MSRATHLALSAFLHRFTPQKREQMLGYLPEEEKQEAESDFLGFESASVRFLSAHDRLMSIHYSWIIPYLETYTKEDAHAFASLFPESTYTKISEALHLPQNPMKLTHIGQRFYAQTLYRMIAIESPQYIPIELLPQHPLDVLLSLSKTKLHLTFDYLGLHDLAVDLKKMVQSHTMKSIHAALTPSKRTYVGKVMKEGEPITFKYLELDLWDGNEKQLANTLHLRGINRVSKALFGCHPSFLWHIRHRLDTGRAKMLDHFCINPKNEKMQQTLSSQVLKVIEHVSNEA